jgi:hypothetical protein
VGKKGEMPGSLFRKREIAVPREKNVRDARGLMGSRYA